MKTKNLIRNFLFVLFVLGSMTIHAQKIYVNRSNGLPVEFNIADIDSISFNPDIRSQSVELTSPIKENTTLRDLGLPIDYYFNGNELDVQNNAILTIEPGVTIQFRNAGGFLYIQDGATLKAIGTPDKHIRFIGAVNDKGSWRGIEIYTGWTSDDRKNELSYVEILNAGSQNYNYSAALYLDNNGKIAVTNSLIDGSSSNGIDIYDTSQGITELTSFSNNTVSNCGKAPIRTDYDAGPYDMRNMDNTNTFTGNGEEYIHCANGDVVNTFGSNLTLRNLNGYPWYFEYGINLAGDQNLTVEPGAVLIMGNNSRVYIPTNSHFIADGTAAAHITIKGFRNEAGYWYGFQIWSLTVGTKLNFCDISDGGGETTYMSSVYMGTGSAPGSNAYLKINNTTISNSLRYGMHLWDYNYKDENCIISSTNPASVIFTDCQLGNIYSNCDPNGYAIYPDLSSTCNLSN